jgi:conjugal transfer pilus assembly protein TraV
MGRPNRLSLGPQRFAALAALAVATSGCAVLGGNVKGSFSCRAPEGNCAPTSVIDGAATQVSGKVPETTRLPSARVLPQISEGRLRVVLTAYRDADGRTHEARVVEVPLPTSAASQFQDPASRREVARALARAVSAARHPDSAAEPPHPIGPPADLPADPATTALPDVLTAPLQHAPAGGPGTATLPARVPHPDAHHEEPAPQEGQQP